MPKTIREILAEQGFELVQDIVKPSGPVWRTGCAKDRSDGTDRFLVYDGQGSTLASGLGTYYCRHQCEDCTFTGDAITFVRTFCGCETLGDALRYLNLPDSPCWAAGVRIRTAPRSGRTPSAFSDGGASHPEPAHSWTPKTVAVPPAPWSAWAEDLLAESLQVWRRIRDQGEARTSDERTALAALEWRGLTIDTAMALEIGWIPERRRVERKDAGLEVRNDLTYMVVPAGLLLPVRRSVKSGVGSTSRIVSMSVRCIPPYMSRGKRVKIKHLAGSRPTSFMHGTLGAVAFLTESVLDAALIWQSSGGRCGVVATLAADLNPDTVADRMLQAASKVVIVPDADSKEGEPLGPGELAARRWLTRYDAAEIIPAVGGKDPGDADRAAREGIPGAMTASTWLAWAWHEFGLPGSCPAVLPSRGKDAQASASNTPASADAPALASNAQAPAPVPDAPASVSNAQAPASDAQASASNTPASTDAPASASAVQAPAGGSGLLSAAEAMQAVQDDGMALAGLPMELRTADVCEAAVVRNPQALRFVPERLRTHDLVMLALERDGTLLAAEVSVEGKAGTDVPPEKRQRGDTRCLIKRRKSRYLATALQHGLTIHAFLRAQSEDLDRIPAGRAYAIGIRCGAVTMEDVPQLLRDDVTAAIRRLASVPDSGDQEKAASPSDLLSSSAPTSSVT